MKTKAAIYNILAQLIVLMFMSGCVTDHAERVYISLPPSSSPPELLTQIPSRPYDVIADVQWAGGQRTKMIQRAQALGGDAVVVQQLGGLVPFASLTAEDANASSTTFTRLSGTVIKFKK